tara:strand:- start:66 stop:449 length:384 start_codon:yes stop_codon:yes gene_type:complete
MQNKNIEYLTKLTVREIRLEAKKSSIHLYSPKNREELIELILKYHKKFLIYHKSNDEVIAEEEIISFENAKAKEHKKEIFEKNSNLKNYYPNLFQINKYPLQIIKMDRKQFLSTNNPKVNHIISLSN